MTRKSVILMFMLIVAVFLMACSTACAEEYADLPGVVIAAGTENMKVVNYSLCANSIYDESFDAYFGDGAEEGVEALLNAEKVFVNGIAIPGEAAPYQLNGTDAIWQLPNGNWTWKSHDVMWTDETGEGVATYAEARWNFLNGLSQFRGMTLVLLSDSGDTVDAIVITILNSGMVAGITENEDGTVTFNGLPVTIDKAVLDDKIKDGDIIVYWIDADGVQAKRATPEDGIYHYEIGVHPWVEAYEVDSINGSSFIDAQIGRIIPEGNRPNQFARALKRLDLQDVSMIGWWTDTHYLIACTRNVEDSRTTLELAIEHAEKGTEGVAVSADGTDVAAGMMWVQPEIWETYQQVLEAAKQLLANPEATALEMDQMISNLADAYGSKMGMGDHMSGPAGVIGSMQEGMKK